MSPQNRKENPMNSPLTPDTQPAAAQPANGPAASGHTRREFLRKAGGAAAATVVGIAALDAATSANDLGPQNRLQRRQAARDLRVNEATAHFTGDKVYDHPDNGDEARYASKIGSYSKGLQHDQYGEVMPASYQSLLNALNAGTVSAVEQVMLGGSRKLSDPIAGLAFDLEGYDSHSLYMPPAPALASARTAAEAVENYCMALTHDVPFTDFDTHAGIDAACRDLNKLHDLAAPRHNGEVTPATVFRGGTAGDLAGPFISQYLWQPIPYGTLSIPQTSAYAASSTDYMTDFASWLAVQNGYSPASVPLAGRRYLSCPRDLCSYVHYNSSYEAALNACLILLGSKMPVNPGNPYLTTTTQEGFGTFGGPHVLSLVAEASARALRAIWYQKWFVHRRLRPEAYGGLVHLTMTGQKDYPLHPDALNSAAVAGAYSKYGTYLMPMAFVEGSPMHPSYGQGHSVLAGACVTILKAWFDETALVPNPVVASSDGSALNAYSGSDLTVGGELNKLVGNIGIGRDLAGVHWRSDYYQSILLGEQVAIGLLNDQVALFAEPSALQFTGFRGNRVTIGAGGSMRMDSMGMLSPRATHGSADNDKASE